MQWKYIGGVLAENYDKAQMNADKIKWKTVDKINKAYVNKAGLKEDLDSPSPQAVLYAILDEEIRGQFINKNSDANDPFVMTKDGIVSDQSLDCTPIERASGTGIRSWKDEELQTANPALMRKAVQAILSQGKEPIFWEFTNSANPQHEKIHQMNLDELRKIFYKEGVDGLKSYEFLAYSPIFERHDLVDRPLIGPLSFKNPQAQVIYVVQGFNLVDALQRHHETALAEFEQAKVVIKEQRRSQLERKMAMLVLMLIIIICSVSGLVLVDQGCKREDGNECNYGDAGR